ncbi:MAG: PTS sugar transporter subunit IIA [Planctomycetia bacterium]|nr:PTS sugar transporter subunit IIA [Planctomycetia bacterium]
MAFSDFVLKEAILPNMQATTAEDALRELVQAIVATGSLDASEVDATVERILEREATGSTALGGGAATPHDRNSSVSKVVTAIGISANGVPFNALDNRPVKLFFLTLTPHTLANEPYFQVMRYIAKSLRDQEFTRYMMQLSEISDVLELLEEQDGKN